MSYIAAFDPGVSAGACAVLDSTGNIIGTWTLEKSAVGKGLNLHHLCKLIHDLETKYHPKWFLESIHSIHGVSKKSTFSMARGLGNIEAALVCNDCEFKLITPKVWQRIWSEVDVVYKSSSDGKKKKRDTKATSLNAVKRLFPNESEKLIYGNNEKISGRRKKLHNGIIDAVLIAYSQI